MSDSSHPAVPAGADPSDLAFTAVGVRPRTTGWTAVRQVAFIKALASTACVTEAAAHVGLSVSSAY